MPTATSPVQSPTLTRAQLLSQLLALHEAGLEPEREFIETHAAALEQLWDSGLSSYQILTMGSGRVRFRAAYLGVLTPKGLQVARSAR